MTLIGYHASHEQYPPSTLLTYVQRAEQAGFEAGMCSDHFHPWSDRQGQSGFTWSWLGAALQATSLSFGTVCAPGQRYHPAIIAQAAATLAEMYPGRLWLAVGSGEWLNEHITGDPWPTAVERDARLKESVDVMRALWDGETVTHDGYVLVDEAKLYTRPDEPPLIVGAALSTQAAAWMAPWVDALVTIDLGQELMQDILTSFRENGGANKPAYVQVQVAYAADDETALREAHEQWAPNVLKGPLLADLKMPAHFEAAAHFVRPEDVNGPVRVSSDPAQHVDWLHVCAALGFERIYVHNVVRTSQEAFIDLYGEKVLPAFKS